MDISGIFVHMHFTRQFSFRDDWFVPSLSIKLVMLFEYQP